jgi:hypothetical protein
MACVPRAFPSNGSTVVVQPAIECRRAACGFAVSPIGAAESPAGAGVAFVGSSEVCGHRSRDHRYPEYHTPATFEAFVDVARPGAHENGDVSIRALRAAVEEQDNAARPTLERHGAARARCDARHRGVQERKAATWERSRHSV